MWAKPHVRCPEGRKPYSGFCGQRPGVPTPPPHTWTSCDGTYWQQPWVGATPGTPSCPSLAPTPLYSLLCPVVHLLWWQSSQEKLEEKEAETKGHDLWGKDSRSSSRAVSEQVFDLGREERVFCPHSHYGFLFQLQSNRNLSFANLDVLLAGGLPEARTACDVSLHTHALSTNNVPSPGDSQFRV